MKIFETKMNAYGWKRQLTANGTTPQKIADERKAFFEESSIRLVRKRFLYDPLEINVNAKLNSYLWRGNPDDEELVQLVGRFVDP